MRPIPSLVLIIPQISGIFALTQLKPDWSVSRERAKPATRPVRKRRPVRRPGLSTLEPKSVNSIPAKASMIIQTVVLKVSPTFLFIIKVL
nr:hypothetical protein [uncultured archaeon]